MAIIVIVLVLGFFVTGCIFIYIQHRSSTTIIIASTTTRRTSASNNAVRGLDKTLIDTFPEFQYSVVKELKLGKGALECAVCLSEFHDEETLRFLPKCDHVFHSECIDAWLAGHHTCPVCRDDLTVAPVAVDEPSVQITIPDKTTRLPRSHSTGHSLNCERFTLRLPTEVRRQLVSRAKLRASSLVVLPRESSSRRGYRGGDGDGEGSRNSRYGRFFGRSFMTRMGSFRTSAKVGINEAMPVAKSSTDRAASLPV